MTKTNISVGRRTNELVIVIERFRQLLQAGWGVISQQFDLDEDLKHDWLQVNWELIVEGALTDRRRSVRLLSYGDGAEGISDRIFLSGMSATHEVKCFAKTGLPLKDHLNETTLSIPDEGFTFYRFVSLNKSGWYVETPPFDMVQVHELTDSVLRYEDLRFELSEIG